MKRSSIWTWKFVLFLTFTSFNSCSRDLTNFDFSSPCTNPEFIQIIFKHKQPTKASQTANYKVGGLIKSCLKTSRANKQKEWTRVKRLIEWIKRKTSEASCHRHQISRVHRPAESRLLVDRNHWWKGWVNKFHVCTCLIVTTTRWYLTSQILIIIAKQVISLYTVLYEVNISDHDYLGWDCETFYAPVDCAPQNPSINQFTLK